MGISDVGMIFKFVGGLGMFLFGMDMMAKGLQQSAGGKMKQWLGVLTRNRLMAVLAGALITAVIQSSSATTVMVVGFVNAGLMNLTQAIGVIMGANIGTTMTSWLVSMNEFGSVLKPEFFAPLLLGIGALLMQFSKKEKRKLIGEILLGFGVLFIGLSFMSGSIEPYRDSPLFSQAFVFLGKNPVLGILAGALITAIIQSSSASVGILQTLALNGMVTWNAAVYITLGQNIGTCVTALLASAGAHRNAKRAAIMHLMFNVVGAILFGIITTVVFLFHPEFGGSNVSSLGISIFHTVFNVTNTIILFPFAPMLVRLAQKILPVNEEEESNPVHAVQQRLKEYRLDTPAFAMEAATHEVLDMGKLCMENVKTAMKAMQDNDSEAVDTVMQNEEVIDDLEKILTEFLVKINSLHLNQSQSVQIRNLMYTINDFERVGDHAVNLAELAQTKIRENMTFSATGRAQLQTIGDTVMSVLDHAYRAREQFRTDDVELVEQLEEKVDNYEEEFRADHISRLNQGFCTATNGVIFLDAISNLERISDHADNIAGYVLFEKKSGAEKVRAD